MERKKKVRRDGTAILPRNRKWIRQEEFSGQKTLTRAVIGGNVEQIREKAFFGCENLEALTLEEGVQYIGAEAFAGCGALRRMEVPDSVADIGSFVFARCTGLEEPVLNRNRSTLFCYPEGAQDPVYRVPEGVRFLARTAFTDNPHLRQVWLPDTLEELSPKAFCRSAIERITIPASVAWIEKDTFFQCNRLEEVVLLGDTELADGAFSGAPEHLRLVQQGNLIQGREKRRILGLTRLRRVETALSDDSHTRQEEFLRLAWHCGWGHREAMWKLGEYFDDLYRQKGYGFYALAGNYWHFMSGLNGDCRGAAWTVRWEKEHPGERIPAVLDETNSGQGLEGRLLYWLGHLAFDEDKRYDVQSLGDLGVTRVCEHPCDANYFCAYFYNSTYYDRFLKPLGCSENMHHPDTDIRGEDYKISMLPLLSSALRLAQSRERERILRARRAGLV